MYHEQSPRSIQAFSRGSPKFFWVEREADEFEAAGGPTAQITAVAVG
jgi:hypothetical protein